ncbi:MAG: glutamate-5-semialdehyde dehydrogenase [Myxococcales bacterium]|nr:glutamate-5-semialdehyde dehydrogenase [Myxococcales bacterium]
MRAVTLDKVDQEILKNQTPLDIAQLAHRAKAASRVVSNLSTQTKNAVLGAVAEGLTSSHRNFVLEANEKDLALAQKNGMAPAMLDRLRLDEARLVGMAKALHHIITLPDPVGEVLDLHASPAGLEIGRMRIPLGLILIIYESRPNVTVDAAALCLKSGNACILRGGSEAVHSNHALADLYTQALIHEGVPEPAVTLIPTTERHVMLELLKMDGVIDLVIPRGGESLIRYVAEHARIPVVRHYKGLCHVYVDAEADFAMAEQIVINAKVQRPGVCNAMETLLVDRGCAQAFLPRIVKALRSEGVEIRGDDHVRECVNDVRAAVKEDYDTEHLDLVVSVAVVDGINGALAHIATHGSQHTEAIVTSNPDKAKRWIREVDASCVLVNASTRFNDGGELGLGAEIGISTTKMHAYGPMGLEELCALKWIGYGSGHIRT